MFGYSTENRKWGVGSGEWGISVFSPLPTPHSPLPVWVFRLDKFLQACGPWLLFLLRLLLASLGRGGRGRGRSHVVDHRFGAAGFSRPGRAALGAGVFGFAAQSRRAVRDRRGAVRDDLGGGEFIGNALLNVRVRFRGGGGFRRLVGLLLHLRFLRRQGGLSQSERDGKQKRECQRDCLLHKLPPIDSIVISRAVTVNG